MTKPWQAFPVAALLSIGLLSQSAVAQQSASDATPTLTARLEIPAMVIPESDPATASADTATPAAAPAAAATPATPATPAAASPVAVVPIRRDAVAKELSEMKARIAQLESELKERDDADAADKDAGALRSAEAGDSYVTPPPTDPALGQAAAPAPAAAAAPTPPEASSALQWKASPR